MSELINDRNGDAFDPLCVTSIMALPEEDGVTVDGNRVLGGSKPRVVIKIPGGALVNYFSSYEEAKVYRDSIIGLANAARGGG